MIPRYKKRLFIHPDSTGCWDSMLTMVARGFLQDFLVQRGARSISALARALGITRARAGQILDALDLQGEYVKAKAIARSSCKKVKTMQKVEARETIKNSNKTERKHRQIVHDDGMVPWYFSVSTVTDKPLKS